MADKLWDLIIVGGGAAGCLLANRLSANSNTSVLLLEAGEDRSDDPNIYTPGLSQALLADTKYDWCYKTVVEPGLHDRSIPHPRGRVLGGSSAINSFALTYPNRTGIDVWETLGAEGWNWATLKPYFARFQTIHEPPVAVREQLSLVNSKDTVESTNGEIQAVFPSRVLPLQKAWVEAWKETGLENQGDSLLGDALGGHTSTNHITADTRERSHAAKAFIKPVESRSNLTIIKGALVDRIIFSQSNSTSAPTATAVEYLQGGYSHVATAKLEIVISAGTFESSAILERSGIGSTTHLERLGIPTVYHNPSVGQNLQDHIRAGLSFETSDDAPPRFTMDDRAARDLYEKERSGPLAETACWAFAYMPLKPLISADDHDDLVKLIDKTLVKDPDVSKFERARQQFIHDVVVSPDEAVATVYMARKPAVLPPNKTPQAGTEPEEKPVEYISLFAMLAHPFSLGHVHISSRSAHDPPVITCNYYQSPLDLDVHAYIVRGLMKLASTPALARYIKPNGQRLPALADDAPLEQIKHAIQLHSSTNYHPTGTCSLLPEEEGGVVDSRLRVYGVRRLRVIDASVMPLIPRCNIISSVYAIAERGAAMVKEDLGLA